MKPRATRRTTKAELAKHVKSLGRSAARARKLTEALRESEERYRRLFDNASDLIATFTLDGVITSLNRAYEVVTGWSRGADRSSPEQDDRARVAARVGRAHPARARR